MNAQQRYPLEGTSLDVSLPEVLSATPEQRHDYIIRLVDAFSVEIENDTMALKCLVPPDRQLDDFRRLNSIAADQYLFTDEVTGKRDVLGKGGPGGTHTNQSRQNMWKMETKLGDLKDQILTKRQKLISRLVKFFDPNDISKCILRNPSRSAIENVLSYLQMQMGSGGAFPPVHARYLADNYLPEDGDCIVLDPCAGWGGRLIGTLLVPRTQHVTYYGIDPEERNNFAYESLTKVVTNEMSEELCGPRSAHFAHMPFEDWVTTQDAEALIGKVNLVMTSPPYYKAERYNNDNECQSSVRYPNYDSWRQSFLRPMIEGAFALLRPGGHFVLNIANVSEAPCLESDSSEIAKASGFEAVGQYQLALGRSPGNRTPDRKVNAVPVRGVKYKREPVFCFRRPLALSAANNNELEDQNC